MLHPSVVFSQKKTSWKSKFRSSSSSSTSSSTVNSNSNSGTNLASEFSLFQSTFPSFDAEETRDQHFTPSTPTNSGKDHFPSHIHSDSSSAASFSFSSPNSEFNTPTTQASTPLLSHKSASYSNLSSPFKHRINSSLRTHSESGSLAFSPEISTSTPKGPNVKAFIFSQPQQSTQVVNKASPVEKCFVCEELLVNHLEQEPLVPLVCGDYLHGECFKLSVEFELEVVLKHDPYASRDVLLQQIFSRCNGKRCINANKDSTIRPSDTTLCDDIISETRASVLGFGTPKPPKHALPPPPLPPQFKPLASKNGSDLGAKSAFFNTSIFNPATPKRAIPPTPPSVRARSYAANTNSLDLSSLSISYSRSPSPTPTMSTSNTVSVKMNDYKNISADTLKNHFIKYLLETCKTFSLTNLLQLGPLRLVDKLFTSFNGSSYTSKIVFLFENYLVVCDEESDTDPVLLELGKLHISTPSASILKFSALRTGLEVWLNSEIDSIIEKWVVAISDRHFSFPVEIITSTIVLPEFRKPVPLKEDTTIMSPTDAGNSSDATINLFIGSARNSVNDPVISKLLGDVTDTSESTDSDSDHHYIQTFMDKSKNEAILVSKNRIDNLFKDKSDDENADTEDSDDESDKELIYNYLQKNNQLTKTVDIERGWNSLISHIDSAISSSNIEIVQPAREF